MRGAFRLGKRGEKEEGSGRVALCCRAVLALVATSLVLATSPPFAAAQRARVHLSADSVKIGERFALSLVADHNFSLEAHFPEARSDSGTAGAAGRFGDLVVLGLRDSSYRYLGQAGMRRDSVVYEVTTFALDTARVPSLPVTFVRDGDTSRAASPERLLPVRSVLPPSVRAGRDSAQLQPLTPPVAFPRPLWPWLLLGAGLLALAALAGYLFWRRRHEQDDGKAAAPPRAPVPPAEAARRRLRRLEQTTDLSDPEAAKPFYTELTHTLRRYLMHRLGLHAFRSTTAELVEQLRQRTATGALPATVIPHARRVLERGDLAKFADRRPPAETRRTALADTRALIDAVEDALRPAAGAEDTENTDGDAEDADGSEAHDVEEDARPASSSPEAMP